MRTSGGAFGICEEEFARIGERRGEGEEGKEVEELAEVVDDAEMDEDGDVEDSFLLLWDEWP